MHLLTHLSEENTATFILQRLRASVDLLPPFEALRKKFVKAVLGLFASAPSRRVRIQALLWLRALGATGDRRSLDDVLKGAYRAFSAHAGFVSKHTTPDIAFMAAGIVELYGLDLSASYEHIFVFVAQLVRVPAFLCV
jgi:nucleolar complex protein 2